MFFSRLLVAATARMCRPKAKLDTKQNPLGEVEEGGLSIRECLNAFSQVY